MNGILLINKEKDYTSRDIVNIVSKELKTKKVGHTGTLDPLATGVLVLCVGEATKIAELLTASYKEYIAEVVLGLNTDTLDITGNVLDEKNVVISKEDISKVLNSTIGKYMQEVPIYSAVKVNGKKLYEYARNNIKVELPKKEVDIKNIELLDYKIENDKTIFKIKCLVSKGTYIRSLIRDIAMKLNTIGTMKSLIRIKQGEFSINDCYSLEDIKNKEFKLIAIDEVLKEYETIYVDEYIENKIKNGSLLENRYNKEIVLFKNKNDDLLALYKIYDKNKTKIKPYKMFLKDK